MGRWDPSAVLRLDDGRSIRRFKTSDGNRGNRWRTKMTVHGIHSLSGRG